MFIELWKHIAYTYTAELNLVKKIFIAALFLFVTLSMPWISFLLITIVLTVIIETGVYVLFGGKKVNFTRLIISLLLGFILSFPVLVIKPLSTILVGVVFIPLLIYGLQQTNFDIKSFILGKYSKRSKEEDNKSEKGTKE